MNRKWSVIALILAVCLVFSSCSARRAEKQLGGSDYLYTHKTEILDAEGQAIHLVSKRFDVTAQHIPTIDELQTALKDAQYNSITLDIYGDMVDDTVSPWALKNEVLDLLEKTISLCDRAEKYLLVDISEYPKDYLSAYEDSEFLPGVISIWQSVAEKMREQKYFGSYILSGFPRIGSSENVTSLTYYEQLLQAICAGIRTKDAEHLITVGIISPYSENEDAFRGFPYIKDRNFAYCAANEALDFFSKQTKEGTDGSVHLTYPNTLQYNVSDVTVEETVLGSDINFASTQYQTRATAVFEVEGENQFARLGVCVMPPDENGGGELRVWEMRFVECDAEGNELNVLYDMKSSKDIPFGCLSASGLLTDGSVYADDGSAYLESINETTFFMVNQLNIPVQKGKHYQLTVTMKQRSMNKNFTCAPQVQLCSAKSYNTLDASYLEQCCNELFDEAKAVGVPIIFDDIGISAQAESKGGKQYMEDLLSIIQNQEQHCILR